MPAQTARPKFKVIRVPSGRKESCLEPGKFERELAKALNTLAKEGYRCEASTYYHHTRQMSALIIARLPERIC